MKSASARAEERGSPCRRSQKAGAGCAAALRRASSSAAAWAGAIGLHIRSVTDDDAPSKPATPFRRSRAICLDAHSVVRRRRLLISFDAAPCGRHGRAAATEARPRRGVGAGAHTLKPFGVSVGA
ncbi:hypothetical protein T492DRAFT_1143271 [Pavlovales sp. CCMP2436]|nr:hypothetical protein T492DRAFT_1143271 [Pavlovales sp. CCMP2436]